MPRIICDGMILQRDTNVKIWGWADVAEVLNVTIAGRDYNTTADNNGKWFVILSPVKAGGPYDLTVKGKDTIVIRDVLFGDVWVCSGQSNMQLTMKETKKYADEIKTASNKQIRLVRFKDEVSEEPKDDIDSVAWLPVDSGNTSNFSAVAYFFAKELYAKYQVPIGLISSNWGGTAAELWMSENALKSFPDILSTYKENRDNYQVRMVKQKLRKENLQGWKIKALSEDKGATDWFNIKINVKDWSEMQLPMIWENNGLPGFDGIIWFRNEIDISKERAGKDLELDLGAIDDMDNTYFNGVLVGSTDGYNIKRIYKVPAKQVKEGKNVIAIQVIDYGGSGGFSGEAFHYKMLGKEVSLSGVWKYKIGFNFKDIPEYVEPDYSILSDWMPSYIFNAMIAPILSYSIKGVIWYQGEANADHAFQYRTLFPALINDWREQWKQGNFPFLFVQLANFKPNFNSPVESDWAELREAQLKTLTLPNTGMAVIIDIGDAENIHPKNKYDVGKRLALAAEKIAYGENIVYSGPIYDTMKIEGNKIRITFKDFGTKLVARKGDLLEFSIAGTNKKFVWAKAKIDGKSVLVWNDNIQNPVAVRYAWADNPAKANLYNKEGLPASPFRTDDWTGLTKK